uniref:Large ribosomal subunit protein P1 n=1 Tax=Coptotermes formosanus TaxID=36987 RepID=R4UV70_COPFO|nr:ribosomal protein P1-like protein [Coptotermes formosanus]
MGSKAELACVYSALILADDDVAITGEKIQTILKAASVDVEPYWPGLFAKALEGINVKDLITNVGSRAGGGTAPRGGNAPVSVAVTEAAPAEKKEEAKKKEESEESDDDMGFGLFE